MSSKDLRMSWACDSALRDKLCHAAKQAGKDASTLSREAVELYLELLPQLQKTSQVATAAGLTVGAYVCKLLESQNDEYLNKIKAVFEAIKGDFVTVRKQTKPG